MGLVKKNGENKSPLEKLRRQKEIADKIDSGALTVLGTQESLVLVIDGSASMSTSDEPSGVTKWNAAREACRELVGASLMSAVGLVVFDERILGSHAVGTQASDIVGALAGMRPRGGTCFANGLELGKVHLDTAAPRPVRRIILLSDGYDGYHSGRVHFERVMDSLVEGKVIVDTVGFGDADEEHLRMIATRTGGVYRHARDAKSLVREFKQLEAGVRGLLSSEAKR